MQPGFSPRQWKLLALLTMVATLAGCATQSDVKVLSPEALATELRGKKVYEFTVKPDGELFGPDGAVIPAGKLAEYLARAKLDRGAYYVLWLGHEAAADGARDAIRVMSAYGAWQFAVRRNETLTFADSGTRNPQNTALIVGKPNPKALAEGDEVPDTTARPEALRPGRIIGRVRYQFASDAEVTRDAAKAGALFTGAGALPADGFDGVMLVLPGAWSRLRDVPALSSTKKVVTSLVQRGRTLELEGRRIATTAEFEACMLRLRELIAGDGGATVRALRSDEMVAWWPFIGFDIEEPTFVVESRRTHYRFIAAFLRGKLLILDDLNGLPVL